MSTVKDVSEFYGKLQGSNAFIGLPEKQEFVQMFDNTQARRGLYEQLRNSGRINGLPDTFEEFSLAFGYNDSGDSRLEQKRHNREVAEDNLRVLREDGLIEEAKGIKKDAAKSKRQARRRSIAEYITSPKMTGTATGVAQPIGQQIAEQNVENALQNEEYRESAELYGEERLLHRTMRDALRDAKNVERGAIGQFAAPLAQKLFNVSTWDMGVSEGLDNLTLSALLEKADDGTITESEEMLLDTLALANVIQQNADAAKSGVTKVAEAIPQSFAFMAQMAANPATGFTRSIAKRAVKKYGVDAMEMGAKELMRNYGGKALARKVGAGLAASIPETAEFVATVGVARSMADAERRAQGNIQTYVDDNGYIQYAGHTEGEDLPTALLKSFGSTFIEGWSEMLGTAAFDPMLSLLKGVKSGKMMSSLADLKKGLIAIKGSEWSVAIKNFKQNAHWDGIINEMLEEEAGMVMSGLFNIENTLNRYNEDGTINENWILDGGNQLRTLLTIAITEGTFKAVEYGGNISELRKMENNLKIAESDGAKIVGARWGEIQKEIDELDPDGVADYIMSLASDPAITNEMLAAATNYATTLVRWQQYNLATDTQEYDDMSEVMRNAMAAYKAGRQMHIANFRSVQQRADKAYDALANRDADLLKRADEWLEQQKQTGKLPTTEIETIRNGLSADMSTLLDEYIGAMTARQGIYDKIDDTAYSQMDVFERDLAPIIRDGAVTTATLDGKPVYVLSQENGSAVILSEDAETEHDGKGMMVDVSRLKDISTIDAKQLVDAYRYRYATDEQTKADMALNHHCNTQMPTVGMQIDTPSAVEGGATTFIVTNVQPQMGYVELVPGEYDAEQGKVVPKDGAEPIYQTVYSTLQMQDEMYDALDAMNGTQSVQVESGIIEGNEQTEEEAPVVTPTEEEVATQEEEVATEETAPAERSQAEIDADDAAELAELGDNDYISSNLDKAKKVLDKAKKKKPKATEKEARLAEARTIKAEVDAAQAEVDRWTAASQEVTRRALQATQTEQAPTGEATGVGENIQSSWAEAEKIEGNTGSKTLQDGTVIKGRYMLVPASAPTASHDALNGYAPSAGFPTNERGQNINDRDYHSDKAAQAETDRIARVYGGQAVNDTPVVSPEGIVYSGNGRTMASQLAAANGTDTAYMEALRSNAAQFGLTPEQVDNIPNARVVFVTDEVLPYTTETFAKFNQQEKKTQSSTERAVSKSKSLKDKSIARILSIIDSYDTLQSFFSSPKACADMLSVLQQDGVITEAEVAGLTELNSNNETILSATGRDLVTDVVLGATFSEQTLRQMGGDKALKQSVLRALPSIIENRQLKEYALNNELENAISLLYEARKAKMSLEQFLQTTDMFEGSPTDKYSAFEVLLAEKFNNSTEAFRVMMQLYNNSASTLVGGQSELFGEALTKEDIQNLILEKYGKQTNNRGDQAESITQSESGNRQDNETTAAERRKKYGITAKEDARREPLRERAREVAEKLGTNINVIEDKSEVTNEDAKKQMRQHKNSIVKGWFENSTGELFIVLPSMDDMADLEATILHELVAHKGLRNLLGALKFNQLCDAVWEMMTPEQQQEWLAYPGVNGNKRAAADEYIASLAEKMDLSEVEQTTWNKIKQFVLDVLQKLGFRGITDNDIQDLIRASYAYMRAGNTNEQTTNEGNRYKVYRSRDGKEVGYTQLSQLSLQFDWGERERDTVSGRNTDVLQREDDATLTTLNTNRQLEEGEVCNVERIFTESKGFDFTSGEKIESAADVAYIFKNLEDEAIENVFVALVKDGKPTVIHVGMGGQAYSLADNSAVVAAANRINPDKVYMVHNHPSGALRCSPQDRMILKSIKDALGDVVQDGIIINTRSGKFGVFSESMFGTDGTSDMPENKEDSPLKVYKFNKQAFKSNVITVEASPNGIAEFISTQRLGSRNKINALLLNNQYGCVGNVFLTETEVNDTNRDSIAQRLVDDAVAMNAKNIVIYGNYPLVSVAVESNIQLREAIEKASGNTVELKDVIEINGSAFPPSALNYGVRFRTTIAPDVRDEKNITHSRFSRGDIEVLATSPNQIKSATDNNGEFGENNDIRFRIVNDLIAVHNLTEDKLRKVFDMGGLIMPSIAITKAGMGHEGYGEISLLFDKDTIDPSDRRNKVFGGDAWTPRIPQLMPKLNEKVSARVKSKIRELIDNRALAEIYSLSANLHQDNIERTISERGVKGYYSEEWMKYAYLLDNGKKVKIPMIEKDYGTHSEMILELLKEKGLKASEINKDAYDFYKNNPDVVEDIKNRINEKKANSVSEDQREALLKVLNKRDMSFNFFSSLIRSAAELEYDLENGGKKQIIDRGALRETINKKVKTDNADYNKWVDNLFEGIVEKYGIRNKTDWYTPSGNLRPWDKLYDAATPANILRYMLDQNEQGGSGGFWDSNIMGASADTYESIEEIREKGQKRLRRVDNNEYDEWATSVANRFSEISDEFLTPAQRNDFGGIIDAKIAITNAVAKDKTTKGIYKEMKADYPNFTMDHANRVVEIVKEIQDYATGYFEAKPQRIVPLREVRKAIVPSNTSEDIVKELKDNGIEVATYRKGNEASRQRLIKKESNGIRFRTTYHGSGAKFDKFDHSFMGTGEGAQAFGWGTYVTEVEGIGRKYGNVALNGRNKFKYVGDKDVNKWTLMDAEQIVDRVGGYEEAVKIYGNKPLAPATALDNVVRFLKSTNKEDWEGQRHLYSVEIPDDNGSNYLHYTLTVGADKAERVGIGLEADRWTLEYSVGNLAKYTKNGKNIFINRQAKGADLYQELAYAFGSEKDASLFLNEIGFVGIAYPAEYHSGGRSDGALNYVIFNEDDLEITNHTMFRIKEVSDKFDEELQQQIDGTLPKGHIYQLGMPSGILQACGFPDMPIELSSTNLAEHSRKTHHPFELNDVKGLVYALQDPVAVFSYGDKMKSQNVIVEIQRDDRNFLIGVHFNQNRRGLEVSDIRGVFPKDSAEWLNWINQGKTLYLDKEKIQDLIHKQRKTLAEVEYLDLDSVAKVIEDFENPTIERENSEVSEDRTMFSVKQRTEADYQDIESRLGIAAAEYERRMDMASVHHMEAWQDSMRSLLEMQRAIEKETGKPILDYENAYMAENRMSSENLAQMEEWNRKFFRPLEDIYKGFIDRGENEFSIRDYLFAKHGMERNAVMARREAQRLYPNDPLQQIAKESDLKRTKDYSGLKKLMGKDNIPDAIAEAQKYVQDFEKKHKAEIAKLWDAIRNATHSQLEVQRASGLLTQEKYEEIKNMYNYYVPLRGFSETTTDEVYDYLDNAPTPYNVPIKAAKGRKSVGDDPIANIANMADSGIMQANRNKMKLHFLNMAERHKTNLVTVSEVIYKYNPVAKMWEPTLPALSPNDTIEETLAKIQQHKAKIAQEMVFNPQDYRFERDLKKMGRDIPYKVINKAMLSEHQVLVMREGKQMVMTINGNPRAAQALNGLTNPEVKAEEQRWIQKVNRFMAANFTSRNPAFVISNLSRDSIYAVSMVWAKEAPKYARAFMNNMGKVFANMASLMHKYNNGTLDTSIPMEKMFLEFVMNGGQTGYTHLNSVEDYKRQMAKEMKRAAQHKGVRAVTETGRAILNGLESMNKWAENISRFTAYVTSREDGRSISRSISDAKEISVNFNKKGAGNSVAGKFEKGNRLNYLSSQTAQLARGLYVFMNAGIQGMANFAKQAKRHPYKITAMIASSMALGLAAALLSGGGDDEEEYLSLPKYTRRNNLCIKVGDKFVTIPLPIELRAFYGIGELIASRTALGEYYSDAEFAKEFAEQLSQLLPIDVLEGGEGFNIKSFIPSAAKPIVDAILNESWTGVPIYNDSEFVKTYPGWKKAYKGTNDMLVDVSRWLNEHSGGSDYRQGVIDINPAAIEYIAEQYLGGVGSTINQFFKMGQTATGAMEFEWRNVPVASRFVNSGNETTQIRAIRGSYYDYREEMDAVGKEFNAYMRDLKKPDLPEEEYQRIEQEIDRIVNSPEYDFYLWWKDINKVINRAKDAGDTEGADELMREAVETYRSWKKGLKE